MIRQQVLVVEWVFTHKVTVHDASRVHVFQASLNRD